MRFATLLALALLLTSCWSRDMTKAEVAADAQAATARDAAGGARSAADATRADAEVARQRRIAQASANLGPISDAVRIQGQPALGDAVGIQKTAIDQSLSLPASEIPAPAVTVEQLLRDAQASLASYRLTNDQLKRAGEEAEAKAKAAEASAAEADRRRQVAEAVAQSEREKADAEARQAWWVKVGTGALGTLATVAALAARFGLPGGQIAHLVAGLVAPALQRRSQEAQVAEVAVTAADVGRQGLAVLDQVLTTQRPELAAELGKVVGTITGGRAGSLNGLFKACAKSYTIDTDGAHVGAVDDLLTKVRGERIETAGGIAVALSKIIKPT